MTTDYLVAQPGGQVQITYSTPQTAFDLLWGTIDNGENSVENSLVFNDGTTVTGTQVGAQLVSEGDTYTPGQTQAYVEITGLTPFTTVTLEDPGTSSAFEMIPGVVTTPEPGTLLMLGSGLIGLIGLRRRTA
jgi:hypothetical protein